MLLAGIDEAGYGPILGPLTVGSCAVRVPDSVDPAAPPCLWRTLRRAVGRQRDRSGRRLHINDSKQVYTPSLGLKELERSVLAWTAACSGDVSSLDGLLGALVPQGESPLEKIAWYGNCAEEQHPAEVDPAAVGISGNALRQEARRMGIQLLKPSVGVLPESQFNRMCRATQNKGSVLFTVAMGRLQGVIDQARPGETVLVVCDRHGGRSHYGPLLRLMFDAWELCVIDETQQSASYLMTRRGQEVHLRFSEKADSQSLPTAMASMCAKYVRERLMGRFNRWWAHRVPDLRPTAGYWSDGKRFLEDIAIARQEAGIADGMLVRER